MRTVILTVALSVVSFFATSQTIENPNVLSKGERLEFMEWYKQSDGKLMMVGGKTDIERYTLQLLEYYGYSDTDASEKGVRVWRGITNYGFAVEMVVTTGDATGVIVLDQRDRK